MNVAAVELWRLRGDQTYGFWYSSSSSQFCAGQRLTPHNRTLEVRPGRITKKLELKYDYDCERDDTKSLLGVLMLGCDIVIANNEWLIEINVLSVCLSACPRL